LLAQNCTRSDADSEQVYSRGSAESRFVLSWRISCHEVALANCYAPTVDESSGGAGRVVRWEILPGLPGEGPLPKPFHLGHPTPWAEGLVVRFFAADGSSWIGNFQRSSYLRPTEVILWQEANVIVVIAAGALYLIDAANPSDYYWLKLIKGIVFDEHWETLFVADSIRLYAFDRDRRPRWIQEGLGGYDIELIGCQSGVLTVELEEEIGEPRKTVRIRAEDGQRIG
jgi:hypothetical protein